MAARRPTIAITTNSSMRVKARCGRRCREVLMKRGNSMALAKGEQPRKYAGFHGTPVRKRVKLTQSASASRGVRLNPDTVETRLSVVARMHHILQLSTAPYCGCDASQERTAPAC